MVSDLTLALVFALHVLLGTAVLLSAFAAGSRGLIPGLITGLVMGGAVILGDLTVGLELLTVSGVEKTQIVLSAAGGAALGIVVAALVFEPGEPDSTDSRPDPTTYTNR